MNRLIEVRRNAAILRPNAEVREALSDPDVGLIIEEQMSRHAPTSRHSLAVGIIAPEMADIFGLNSRQKKALVRGVLIHDVGKNALAVTAPGLFDEPNPDWTLLRQHPTWGEDKIAGLSPLIRALVVNHHRLQGPRSYPGPQIDWKNTNDPYLPADAEVRVDLERTLPILVGLDVSDALLGNDRDYLLDPCILPDTQRANIDKLRNAVRKDYSADKEIFDIIWNRVRQIFSTPAYYS